MPADGLNQGSTAPETRELRTTARSSQYSRTLAEAETTFSLAASQQETGGVSDRIGRLAQQNTSCTTEYGTASVDRSLTVPTGA
jgi:hypothetical protein